MPSMRIMRTASKQRTLYCTDLVERAAAGCWGKSALGRRMVVAAGCWILGPRPGPKPRMARVRPRRGHEAGQIGSSLELGLAGHTR